MNFLQNLVIIFNIVIKIFTGEIAKGSLQQKVVMVWQKGTRYKKESTKSSVNNRASLAGDL